jgi:ferritin-like metal-binding protein YciE
MIKKPNQSGSWKKINLEPEQYRGFFINHLNRIYIAKEHLVVMLPKLVEKAQFIDLKNAIIDTVEAVRRQIARMEMIYALLDAEISHCSINGIKGLVDDAFQAIQEQSEQTELRDLSIIFYLQNIESVEMASFQILQMAAVQLKNRQISQLLKENYQEAKADRTLLLYISSKYVI